MTARDMGTDETKSDYARRLVAEHGSVRAAAREAGIARRTLRDWLAGVVEAGMPKADNARVLLISDLHAPHQHPDALSFLVAIRDAIKPTRTISVGDETDYHDLSFHDSDPDLDSASAELEKARKFLRALAKELPDMDLAESNHGAMPYRRAHAHGLPSRLMRGYREVLFGEDDGTGGVHFPGGLGAGWRWHPQIRLDLPNGSVGWVRHGYGNDLLRIARENGCCLVQGHHHGLLEARHARLLHREIWAMSVGCLIDPTHPAFAYGKSSRVQPVIGCGVILDGEPIAVRMPLDKRGRWTGRLPALGAR